MYTVKQSCILINNQNKKKNSLIAIISFIFLTDAKMLQQDKHFALNLDFFK